MSHPPPSPPTLWINHTHQGRKAKNKSCPTCNLRQKCQESTEEASPTGQSVLALTVHNSYPCQSGRKFAQSVGNMPFSFLPMLVLLPEDLCCPGASRPQSCSPSAGLPAGSWVAAHVHLTWRPPAHLTPPPSAITSFQSGSFSCLVLSSSEISQTYLRNVFIGE